MTKTEGDDDPRGLAGYSCDPSCLMYRLLIIYLFALVILTYRIILLNKFDTTVLSPRKMLKNVSRILALVVAVVAASVGAYGLMYNLENNTSFLLIQD